MWWILVLSIIALITIKVVKLSNFWAPYGIPYESFPRYVYRILWVCNTRVLTEVIREEVKRYGPIYGSYRGVRPVLIVSDIDVAKDVLIKQFNNFFGRSFEFQTGDPLWDNAIMHQPYPEWKTLRTIMGYTFTTSKMRGMIPKIDKLGKRLVSKIQDLAKSSKNVLVLKQSVRAFAIDSMAAVSFGLDPNCIENSDGEYMKHAKEMIQPGLAAFLFFIVPKLMKYVPFVEFPDKMTSRYFGKLAKHSLTEKRRKLDDVIASGTADILDLHLIALREDKNNAISDEMLASQAFLFLVAGTDGIVAALHLSLYHLAVNPETQRKAYDEVMTIMKDRTVVEYEDVMKMKYLEGCLLETLRLLPINPALDRICTVDTEVNGIKIKKGMMIEFPLPFIHMDPKNFPEPDRFLPDRFVRRSDAAEDQDTRAFFMFGDGPKNCVGRRLALMIMQTCLANIIMKIQLERVAETPYPLEIKTGFQVLHFEKKPMALGVKAR